MVYFFFVSRTPLFPIKTLSEQRNKIVEFDVYFIQYSALTGVTEKNDW